MDDGGEGRDEAAIRIANLLLYIEHTRSARRTVKRTTISALVHESSSMGASDEDERG